LREWSDERGPCPVGHGPSGSSAPGKLRKRSASGQAAAKAKLEAVRLIKQRGVSYAQASKDLGVHPTQLRNWVKQLADDPQHAFPGHGQMKPEQLEIAQLKREVARLKAERDILKKAAAYFAKEST
jgi:transposase